MANASLRYDPAGRCEVKVEDVEYRLAGWPEPAVTRLIERIKGFIAKRIAAATAAS